MWRREERVGASLSPPLVCWGSLSRSHSNLPPSLFSLFLSIFLRLSFPRGWRRRWERWASFGLEFGEGGGDGGRDDVGPDLSPVFPPGNFVSPMHHANLISSHSLCFQRSFLLLYECTSVRTKVGSSSFKGFSLFFLFLFLLFDGKNRMLKVHWEAFHHYRAGERGRREECTL